jgi:hypothetical protein
MIFLQNSAGIGRSGTFALIDAALTEVGYTISVSLILFLVQKGLGYYYKVIIKYCL